MVATLIKGGEFNFRFCKGLKRGEIHLIEMRTCLSSFSDFFKDLACVPHDIVKNVEETTAAAVLTEVKNDPTKEESENTLVEKTAEDEVGDVDSVYDDTPSNDNRTTVLEACIIIAPLVIGVFYSYLMTAMLYHK